MREYQKAHEIAVDGSKVYTQMLGAMLKDKGVTCEVEDNTAFISYHVTHDVGTLGGKVNSYELLKYTDDADDPNNAKKIAASNLMIAVKTQIESLGITVPEEQKTGDEAKDMKLLVKEFQKKVGMTGTAVDGIVGRDTSVALAQAQLRSVVGECKDIDNIDASAIAGAVRASKRGSGAGKPAAS